ncbi:MULTISPECIES: low molecular weight phosphotyrosine protein phosphatase [unclassified Agrobacterium]|uniref:low molecular weight protein-tyrosine-phosphatase n=1 Tax=unclassified Agrobacterium TaxID=2632611 RepID=UPI002449770D|nr:MULTISPECIES: low molecular weight phosphotyrosine protein phosphatase [unclassified Agrobacterium]MDH0614677.1 low molecular weight phosphotyrosine protein phosphatase [Agrobacterium sp. GD03872]MDH0697080.1 low molecular weight phosphotyrosine protein phosphatase [Agrobacterium sp. GD03871]MDH1059560.1 low molecular weight phosphotyrosine protein phosphatase [Agrobacterium sp. GD03992]MDH2212421.1 low molecular weight phosphotyrosine protein phosphatase [Agrobacterium sp. GD03643]MDH22199
MKHTAILFVCMGNICRSPLAEGVLRHLADDTVISDQLTIDSAGTGGWHAGDAPDPRSIAMARQHGIDISRQRARQVTRADFDTFDLILAMDENNLAKLLQASPEGHRHKIHLFMDYAAGRRENVPDPYYGAEDGFLKVYNMLLAGCRSLLEKMELDRAS